MNNNSLSYKEVVDLWKHYAIDRTGTESDDSSWSSRALLDKLLLNRSAIIERELKLGKDLGEQSIQQLPCISLSKVPIAECPSTPPSGCSWLRSSRALPRYLKIISVSTIDGATNFNFVRWDMYKYETKYSRIKTKDDNFYYTIREVEGENYLYVLGSEFLKKVSFSAIFEDPYQARIFPKCRSKKVPENLLCNPWETPFLLNRSYLDEIFLATWSTLPAIRKNAGSDIINDDLDNTYGDINDTT